MVFIIRKFTVPNRSKVMNIGNAPLSCSPNLHYMTIVNKIEERVMEKETKFYCWTASKTVI